MTLQKWHWRLAINKDSVTIDANHPLAGQTLSFSVSIESVRDATKEELEHGHIHAHGGSCSH
jgi:FKBP-type peptidyl-prolyl cis-trans isomerase SlyD